MRIACLVAALLLRATAAHAEPSTEPPVDAVANDFHLTGGVEYLSGAPFSSVAFRGQLLAGAIIGHGAARPTFTGGLTFAVGKVYVDSPDSVAASTASLDYHSIGPIAQVGVDLSGVRLFASAAYVLSHIDQPVAVPALRGVAIEGGGARGSVGINDARMLMRIMSTHSSSMHDEDAELVGDLLLTLMPQQLELTVERDPGTTRWGLTVSWGI
jgi:hypothetical protein